MKIRYSGAFVLLLFPLSVLAQTRTAPPSAGVATAGARTTFVYRGELGKWWQNSDVARKLQLSDGQISQLDQTFYDHKLKLIDYGAEMEKQDLKLQTLLDADVPRGPGRSPGGPGFDRARQAGARIHHDESRSAQSAVPRAVAAVEVDSGTGWEPRRRPDILSQSTAARRRALDCASAAGRDSIASPSPSARRRDVLKNSTAVDGSCSAGILPAGSGASCPRGGQDARPTAGGTPALPEPVNALQQYGRRFPRVRLSLASSPRKPDEIWRHHFPRIQLRP